MTTRYDQLLQDLQAAQGDTGKLALVTFDFAVAHDPLLKTAAEVSAIPHWFDSKTLAALLPEHADQADCLLEALTALPMVEPYTRGNGEDAWNLHEATRLALRNRLWAEEPERFKALSRRAASAYGSADPDAPDFTLTCEHVYHQLAGQTHEGDATMESVAGYWRVEFRVEPLQTLARLLEELLDLLPNAPLLRRGEGLAHQAIADARIYHQPTPTTVARLRQAEANFRYITTVESGNVLWQRDLSISLGKLGELALKQGDLAEATRCLTESKSIREHIANSDPTNISSQRDLSVSLSKLGDLALAQGDLARALHYFEEDKKITERLVACEPNNTMRHRDLSVTLERIGDLALIQSNLSEAMLHYTKSNAIAEHLVASDSTNTAWQRDFAFSLERLGDLAVKQGDLNEALRCYSESKPIRERLAASDSGNDEWQRDLMYICGAIATEVLMPQECWKEALELIERSLEISQRLARIDPTNILWQKDARLSRVLVEELRAKLKEAEGGEDAAMEAAE